MPTYTIEELRAHKETTQEVIDFIRDGAQVLAGKYNLSFDFKNFAMFYFLDRGRFWVCHKDGVPVGFMLISQHPWVWDWEQTVVIQETLYAKPGTRAAHYLMKHFIDYGRKHADHVFTMIAAKTNIKPRSLERMGFKHHETLFRLEK